MTTASAWMRRGFAALVALSLALRLLSPAGFMPAFDHGAVTIVACPDAGVSPIAAQHHHPASQHELHQHCPYAVASSLGTLPGTWAPPAAPVALAAALLVDRAFAAPAREQSNRRPPPTGPPPRS